jgi:hypothetical protein
VKTKKLALKTKKLAVKEADFIAGNPEKQSIFAKNLGFDYAVKTKDFAT